MHKKNKMKAVVFAIIAVLIASTSTVSLADWTPGDGHKMHYPQLPYPNGVDVDWGFGALGDDWQCIETGNVDDIHFWISWYYDEPMVIPSIDVSIWSNNPQGPGGWSEPLDLLWQRTFLPGEFVMRHYGDGNQLWMIPPGEIIQQPHFGIYQINIIDIFDPFEQTEGEIYWLLIEMPWVPPYTVGWKTSVNWFMDHPVWLDPTGMWIMIDGIEFAFVITGKGMSEEREFGDAPEDGIAYPSTGTIGAFPTCKTCGTAGWIEHNNFGAWFGPTFDFETDGNAGLCPNCFPTYDDDECFQDGDAGLIVPEPFTIDAAGVVVPCPNDPTGGTPLGNVGQTAVWGINIDIDVHNTMPNHEPYVIGYVNVLVDWNQNGVWGDPGEHVLQNFVVPALYIGPLSVLGPPDFVIGPNPGYVWTRFSITESPVVVDWNGEGSFEDGETEDYLLLIEDEPSVPSVDIEKYVWDGQAWVDYIEAEVCTFLRFNLSIHNTGPVTLIVTKVWDVLPPCLVYADSATVNGDLHEPDVITPPIYEWNHVLPADYWGPGSAPNELPPDEWIYIEFDVHVISEGININEACVDADSAGGPVSDCDTATVSVPPELIVVTSLSYKWNMISVPFTYSVNKADFYVEYGGTYYTWADAVSGGIVVNTLFGWNRISQGYAQPSGGILYPDCGYWMWAYYDCILKVLAP